MAANTNWHWRCPRCGQHLLWVRDTLEGRHLVSALVRASGRPYADLIADGTLCRWDYAQQGPRLICHCDDDGA